MALFVPHDGPAYIINATTHPDAYGDAGMTLEHMQHLVGGYIEHVSMHPIVVGVLVTTDDGQKAIGLALPEYDGPDAMRWPHLVVNEEGKLDGLPINPVATDIARRHGLPDDVIVGHAIFLEEDEMQ